MSLSVAAQGSAYLLTQRSWTRRIGTGFRKCSFSRPRLRVLTSPASSSTRRCFITPNRVIATRRSSAPSVWPSRLNSSSSRLRRVGSARALNTSSIRGLYVTRRSHVKREAKVFDVAVSSPPSTSARADAPEVLERFHPAVRAWFERRFPDGPTEAQRGGWPAIVAGEHTLICAPTGSGKTLAGFLAAIDALYSAHADGESIEGATRVVYLSPLKALAVDVHANLEEPLAEIAEVARELGHEPAPITVGVRTGDSTSSERQLMVRNPPNLLVTTPESLYLYLTAERSRATLETVETVIVDEIHALARDKRGSHLAVSLERLRSVAARAPVRIGLSATVRPLETAAGLLVGAGE